MSGLDSVHLLSFRISSQPLIRPNSNSDKPTVNSREDTENCCPNSNSDKPTFNLRENLENCCPNVSVDLGKPLIDRYEAICQPNGEGKVVVCTTSLRGVKNTFDDCKAVRSAAEGFRVLVSERDISMDRGFMEELRELMLELELLAD